MFFFLPTVKGLESRSTEQIAVPQSKAKEFLSALHRSKRNVWDRSRPDVQHRIQQFMYMGYDEAVSQTVYSIKTIQVFFINFCTFETVFLLHCALL